MSATRLLETNLTKKHGTFDEATEAKYSSTSAYERRTTSDLSGPCSLALKFLADRIHSAGDTAIIILVFRIEISYSRGYFRCACTDRINGKFTSVVKTNRIDLDLCGRFAYSTSKGVASQIRECLLVNSSMLWPF